MSSFQNTPSKDLSIIKNLLKLDFPPTPFEIFSLFQWNRLKIGNLLEVAGEKFNFNKFLIMLRSFQGMFWKEEVQGYLNLDSYFAFQSAIIFLEVFSKSQSSK